MTDERFLAGNLDVAAREAFFATGEADVAHLFDIIGTDFAPQDALDFGCGVGRLTRALSARVPRVVGLDVSPTMLELARANVPGATFSQEIPADGFDFIVSIIVLQHIAVDRGMEIIRDLAGRLRPGGAIALQVTTRRGGGAMRRLARWLRSRVPLLHRIAARLESGHRDLPYMEMNAYDPGGVRELLQRAGCAVVRTELTDHGGIEGVLIVARKSH